MTPTEIAIMFCAAIVLGLAGCRLADVPPAAQPPIRKPLHMSRADIEETLRLAEERRRRP